MLSIIKSLQTYVEWNTKYAILGMLPKWSYNATVKVSKFGQLKPEGCSSKEFKQVQKILYAQLCANIVVGAFYIAFFLATLTLLISAIPSLIIYVIKPVYIALKGLSTYTLGAIKLNKNNRSVANLFNYLLNNARLTFIFSPLHNFIRLLQQNLKTFIFFLQRTFENYKYYKTMFTIYKITTPLIALLSLFTFIKVKQSLKVTSINTPPNTVGNINRYFYEKHILNAPNKQVAERNTYELENEHTYTLVSNTLPNQNKIANFKALVLTVSTVAGICASLAPIASLLGASQKFFQSTKTLNTSEEMAVSLVHDAFICSTEHLENWLS